MTDRHVAENERALTPNEVEDRWEDGCPKCENDFIEWGTHSSLGEPITYEWNCPYCGEEDSATEQRETALSRDNDGEQ